MEPLWSPVVATGGNQREIGSGRKWRKQAKPVAAGCHRLPETFHGKDGAVPAGPVILAVIPVSSPSGEARKLGLWKACPRTPYDP
jgi:hypothetical protein